MAMNLTKAKPYAKAIFNLALSNDQIVMWRDILEMLAQVAIECTKSGILCNPKVEDAIKVGFFSEVILKFPAGEGLIKLLAERKKLTVLPEILVNYQQMCFAYNQILKVKVVSMCELSDIQKEQLNNALNLRYNCKILLQYCIDAELIGGGIIHIADRVVDHSIRGILQNLKHSLTFKEQPC